MNEGGASRPPGAEDHLGIGEDLLSFCGSLIQLSGSLEGAPTIEAPAGKVTGRWVPMSVGTRDYLVLLLRRCARYVFEKEADPGLAAQLERLDKDPLAFVNEILELRATLRRLSQEADNVGERCSVAGGGGDQSL